ncbi:hypothetical protein ABW19_dt0200200 [Dactylella cylindrospora]|nr:hypothetical protein ABW19_dt0200200 [Dactylella cylindrospora]
MGGAELLERRGGIFGLTLLSLAVINLPRLSIAIRGGSPNCNHGDPISNIEDSRILSRLRIERDSCASPVVSTWQKRPFLPLTQCFLFLIDRTHVSENRYQHDCNYHHRAREADSIK